VVHLNKAVVQEQQPEQLQAKLEIRQDREQALEHTSHLVVELERERELARAEWQPRMELDRVLVLGHRGMAAEVPMTVVVVVVVVVAAERRGRQTGPLLSQQGKMVMGPMEPLGVVCHHTVQSRVGFLARREEHRH
jgi:hypothetical protein